MFVEAYPLNAPTTLAIEKTLTLAFVIDAALRFRLKLGLDAVEELVQALGWARLGAPHDGAGRVMVHGGGWMSARVGVCGDEQWEFIALCAIETRKANRGMRRCRCLSVARLSAHS